MEWALQDAKNRLSEVINQACSSGPQTVTRRGKKTVVIVAYDEYQRLCRPATSLTDFFRNSPLTEVELELERDRSPARDLEL